MLKVIGPPEDLACELCGDDGPSRCNVLMDAQFAGETKRIEAVLCAGCRQVAAAWEAPEAKETAK